jgi:hypothetical protein
MHPVSPENVHTNLLASKWDSGFVPRRQGLSFLGLFCRAANWYARVLHEKTTFSLPKALSDMALIPATVCLLRIASFRLP